MGKRNKNLLPDEIFVGAPPGGQQTATIDRGILMIHARRDGEGQFDRVMGHSQRRIRRRLRAECDPSFGDDGRTVRNANDARRRECRWTK